MTRNALLIFHSIHKVMRAEKALKEAGLDVRLIPVPRQLSSDCGLALACRLEERGRWEEELEAAGTPFEELYGIEGEGYRKVE